MIVIKGDFEKSNKEQRKKERERVTNRIFFRKIVSTLDSEYHQTK